MIPVGGQQKQSHRLTMTGGTINGTVIGGVTPAAITGTAIVGTSLSVTSTSIAPVTITTTSASDAPGIITLVGGGGGAGFRILPIAGATKYNWEFSAQVITDNVFGITPSTAPGGSTFTTSALTIAGATGAVGIASTLTVTGGFGCNTKAAQTSYVSGGALNAYGAGANGFDSGANASALHALVVAMRAALVANGIMS
mgnify:FL=1